jgi:pimeloyl-ACP methyl ester carboxylesterase
LTKSFAIRTEKRHILFRRSLVNLAWVVPSLACLVYFICAPRYNEWLYQPFLFHPEKLEASSAVPTIGNIKGENVHFYSTNGHVLNGWYFKNPSAKYTVLFNHGNGGNIADQTDLVELIAKAGASVFIYDYEGFGASDGTPSIEGMCDDAVAAFNYLHMRCGLSKDSIVLYGQSLGAAVAAYLTTKFECRGVILQSGFSSLRQIACEDFPLLSLYPYWLFPQQSLNTASIISNPHPPLLLIHGQQDDVVRYTHAISLFAAAIGEKQLVTLATTGHEDIATTASIPYTEALRHFLSSLDSAS